MGLALLAGANDLFAEIGSTLPPAKVRDCLTRICNQAIKTAEQDDAAPYVPSNQIVVDAMLAIARIQPDDFLIDLGSGDGRVVLGAALRGARGVGIDTDEQLVERANTEARKRGLADRALFHVQDVFTADLSQATVVTMYLLPRMMDRLKPRLMQLKPGTRIVSNDYSFRDWPADGMLNVPIPADCALLGKSESTVYRWNVRAGEAAMPVPAS